MSEIAATTRRAAMFGSAAAVLAGAASAAPENPDAELIEACARVDALERESHAICFGPNKIEGDNAIAEAHAPIWRLEKPLLARIVALHATTLEGLRARVRTLYMSEQELGPVWLLENPEEDYRSDLELALLRDIAAFFGVHPGDRYRVFADGLTRGDRKHIAEQMWRDRAEQIAATEAVAEAPLHPDAELLAACERHAAAAQEIGRLNEVSYPGLRHDDPIVLADEAAMSDALGDYFGVIDEIADLPALTAEGVRAKSVALVQLLHDFDDRPLAASLRRDLLGGGAAA